VQVCNWNEQEQFVTVPIPPPFASTKRKELVSTWMLEELTKFNKSSHHSNQLVPGAGRLRSSEDGVGRSRRREALGG
jgi:hypothetical protein